MDLKITTPCQTKATASGTRDGTWRVSLANPGEKSEHRQAASRTGFPRGSALLTSSTSPSPTQQLRVLFLWLRNVRAYQCLLCLLPQNLPCTLHSGSCRKQGSEPAGLGCPGGLCRAQWARPCIRGCHPAAVV